MFLLQSLTPPEHEVLLIDGNAQPMDEAGIAQYVKDQNIGLVGIGAMTRMIAKAYRMADAIRAVGVPVVMGGPHVTEEADEALGRDGGERHCDAVALGEADETWPQIVKDAVAGQLKDIYAPVDAEGKDKKPSLKEYPAIPWNTIDLDQFNLLPKIVKPMLDRVGEGWGTFRIVPVESGRGCPYGCEFCTVTRFFGDSIRFRTNESVVNELLMLKARARKEKGQIAVFFIDDNFAIGMESIDPTNLKDVNKGFNKPGEYAAVLQRLAQRNVYAITSFIFGMDNDTVGVAERTLQQVRTWPPGLPIFGLLTPLPATPLYKRLEAAGRLTRPKHWKEFIPFAMAHTPLRMEPRLQLGSNSQSHRIDGRPAAWLPHQHLHSPHVFPRNLLPHDGKICLGKSNRPKLANNLQNGKRRRNRKTSTKRKAGKVERVSRRSVSTYFLNTKRPRLGGLKTFGSG